MLDLIVAALSRILVPLFLLGMAGATVVVAITFVHDVIDFFKNDDLGASSNHRS